MIKIETAKIIIDNARFRKIIGIKMLNSQELPEEYTKNAPYVCLLGNKVRAKETDITISYCILRIGDVISEVSFQHILKFIKLCGSRLQEINKKLRKDWEGIETITI